MIPLVVAHRGASWAEPENSLAAFRRAIDAGVDYVELDVHAAPDGRLLVCHDRPHLLGEVPLLEEVLELTTGRAGVVVDLKHPYRYRGRDFVRRTLDLLDADCIVASFEPRALEEVRRLRPELRTLQHVANVPLRRAAGYAWAVGLEDSRATPTALSRARRLALETAVYTVNEPRRMAELAGFGVKAIITDRPDVLRRTLAAAAA